MEGLTIVVAYYENPAMLGMQYANFKEMSAGIRKACSLIVVDDGSPTDPAVCADIGVNIALYRMLVDVRWNQDACRNLGVHMSRTEWLLLTDIDHLIPEATLSYILQADLNPETVYVFERALPSDPAFIKPHPNSWLMTRAMYEAIGGYDERLAGFYGTDRDFRARVQETARDVVRLPAPLVLVLPDLVPDAWTRRYGRNEAQDLEILPKIIADRNSDPDWRPLRLSFPWREVYVTANDVTAIPDA